MNISENPFNEPVPAKALDRRLILVAGVILLASLGSVYAWSFFTRPLQAAYGWSNAQVSIVFSLAVAGLGFSALYTGPLVSKLGGRRLMKRSAKFFVSGYLISALGLYLGSGVIGGAESAFVSWLSFLVLAFGYGVIGGIGLGTGYVTAVSTVAGWFPDRKGFATGMIVMGFGMGALFMSKVFAPFSMKIAGGNVAIAFLFIAAVYAVIMMIACHYIYSPHASIATMQKATVADTYPHKTNARVRLWLVCFLYSVAGLGIISLLSPLMQNLLAANDPSLSPAELAAAGATLIAIASIGNSVGRLFWAWTSDGIGRVNAFIILLGTSALAYLLMPQVSSPLIYSILICYVIACYGGGFGTIPSLISDLFGPKRMSAMHGLVLTGWAVAGLTAPPLFGYMNDTIPEHAANAAYYICAGSLVLSTIIVWTFKGLHRECGLPDKRCP
ncbi:MAG: MFS transporter [Puniceicoccaceae bacterium]|nr:MAG: MFS transporter [Puniceicoccaceae bacterium]